ncbi:hypothetical protein TGMAS_262990 [Toxoplasma gondii MAS]|uniref:Uncharacterized protein n=1 Tax=Toxoplasma gondii MAS TaxID=943118 RepID=A0A086Q525_TOXGO|nr:hypothetical protein TGMAS_262990 [Toxoplasma gondii MAS]
MERGGPPCRLHLGRGEDRDDGEESGARKDGACHSDVVKTPMSKCRVPSLSENACTPPQLRSTRSPGVHTLDQLCPVVSAAGGQYPSGPSTQAEPCDGLSSAHNPADRRPSRISREHPSPLSSPFPVSLASPCDLSLPSSQSAVSAFSSVSLASVRRVKAVSSRQEGDASAFVSPTSYSGPSVSPASPLSAMSFDRVCRHPAFGSCASVALSEFTTPDKSRTDDFASVASSFLPAASLPASSRCPSRPQSCPSSPNAPPASVAPSFASSPFLSAALLSPGLRRQRFASPVGGACSEDAQARVPPRFSRSLSHPATRRLSASTLHARDDCCGEAVVFSVEKTEMRRQSFSFFSSADFLANEDDKSPKSFLGKMLATPRRVPGTHSTASEEASLLHPALGDENGLYVACFPSAATAELLRKSACVVRGEMRRTKAREDAASGREQGSLEEGCERRARALLEPLLAAFPRADAACRLDVTRRGLHFLSAGEGVAEERLSRDNNGGQETTANSGIGDDLDAQLLDTRKRGEAREVYGQSSPEGERLSHATRKDEAALPTSPSWTLLCRGVPQHTLQNGFAREAYVEKQEVSTQSHAAQTQGSPSTQFEFLGSRQTHAMSASSPESNREGENATALLLSSERQSRRTRPSTDHHGRDKESGLLCTVQDSAPAVSPSRTSPVRPGDQPDAASVRGREVTINKPTFAQPLRGFDRSGDGRASKREKSEETQNEEEDNGGDSGRNRRSDQESGEPARVTWGVEDEKEDAAPGRDLAEVEQEEEGEPEQANSADIDKPPSQWICRIDSGPGGDTGERELAETRTPLGTDLSPRVTATPLEGERRIEDRTQRKHGRRGDRIEERGPNGDTEGVERRTEARAGWNHDRVDDDLETDVDESCSDSHAFSFMRLTPEATTDTLDTSPESAVPILFRVFDAQGSLCPSCRLQLQPPLRRPSASPFCRGDGPPRLSASSLPSLPSLASFASGSSAPSLDLSSFFATARGQVPPVSIVFGRKSGGKDGGAEPRPRAESLGPVARSRVSRFFSGSETDSVLGAAAADPTEGEVERNPQCPEARKGARPCAADPRGDWVSEASSLSSDRDISSFQRCSCSALYVVGSLRLLGEWKKRRGVRLRTSPELFPYYISPPVFVPRHLRAISYRFARLSNTSASEDPSHEPSMHVTPEGQFASDTGGESEGVQKREIKGENERGSRETLEREASGEVQRELGGGSKREIETVLKEEDERGSKKEVGNEIQGEQERVSEACERVVFPGPSGTKTSELPRRVRDVVAVSSTHPFLLQRVDREGSRVAEQRGEGERRLETGSQGEQDSSERARGAGKGEGEKTFSWFCWGGSRKEGNPRRAKQKKRDEGTWDVELVHGDRRLKPPRTAAVISHTFGVNDKGISRHATHNDLVEGLALCLGTPDWNLPVFTQGGRWYEMERPERELFLTQSSVSPSSCCPWDASAASLSGDYLSFLWRFAVLLVSRCRWPFAAWASTPDARLSCLPVSDCLLSGAAPPGTFPLPASSASVASSADPFSASASSSFSSASCLPASPRSAAEFSSFGVRQGGDAEAPLLRVGRVTDVGKVRRRRREEKKLREEEEHGLCFKFFALRTLTLLAHTEHALYLAADSDTSTMPFVAL